MYQSEYEECLHSQRELSNQGSCHIYIINVCQVFHLVWHNEKAASAQPNRM